MAKKDDFDFDDELNFDDFDAGNFDDFGAEKDDRTPITRGFNSFKTGLKDKLTSEQTIRKVTARSLPIEYSEPINKAFEIKSQAKDIYDVGTQEVTNFLNVSKRSIGRINKRLESSLPKGLHEKIQKFADSATDDYGRTQVSKEETETNTINAAFAEIFAKSQEVAIQDRRREESREILQSKVSEKRHLDNVELLGSIDASLQRLSTFQSKEGTNFMKKSLELQFRSYFMQTDSYQLHVKSFDEITKQLAAITKNTGLPDYVKKPTSEAFMEHMRASSFDAITESLAQKRNKWLSKVGERIKGKIKDSVESFSGNFLMASDMIADTLEQGDEADPGMLYDLAGDFAADYAEGKISNKVAQFLTWAQKKNPELYKKIRKGGFRLNDISNQLPQFMKHQMTDGAFAEKFEGTAEFLRFFFDVDESQDSLRFNKEVDLERAKQWSDKNSRTLNIVIPELLSKIHRELYVTRTGDDSAEEIVYDYEKGKFVTKKERQHRLLRDIVSKEESDNTSKTLTDIFKHIDPDNTLTTDQKRSIGEAIYAANQNNQYFNEKTMTSNKVLGEHHEVVSPLISAFIDKTDDGSNRSKLAGLFSSVGSNLKSKQELIQAYIDAGRQSELHDIGIINTAESIIDDKNMRLLELGYTDLYQDAVQAEEDRKKQINEEISKGGLANITYDKSTAPIAKLLEETGEDNVSTEDSAESLEEKLNDPNISNKEKAEIRKALKNKKKQTKAEDILGRKEHVGATSVSSIRKAIYDTSAKSTIGEIRDILKEIRDRGGLGTVQLTPELMKQILSAMGGGSGFWGKLGTGIKNTAVGLAKGIGRAIGGTVKGLWWAGSTMLGKTWELGSGAVRGAYNLLAEKREEFDLHIGNSPIAAMTAAKMRAGKYVDSKTKKVIRKFEDIKGDIIDTDTGEVVVRATELKDAVLKNLKTKKSILLRMTSWGGKLVSGIWTAVTTISRGLFGAARGMFGFSGLVLQGAWWLTKATWNKYMNPIQDVYVKININGEEKLRLALRKQLLENGAYTSRKTGKVIQRVSDIDGAVMLGSEVVITDEEASKGFYDHKGKVIRTPLAKILSIPGKILGGVIGAGKWLWDKGTGIMKGTWGWIKELFGKFSPIHVMNRTTNKILISIYNLLNDRMPGIRSPEITQDSEGMVEKEVIAQEKPTALGELRNKIRRKRERWRKIKEDFNSAKESVKSFFGIGKKRLEISHEHASRPGCPAGDQCTRDDRCSAGTTCPWHFVKYDPSRPQFNPKANQKEGIFSGLGKFMKGKWNEAFAPHRKEIDAMKKLTGPLVFKDHDSQKNPMSTDQIHAEMLKILDQIDAPNLSPKEKYKLQQRYDRLQAIYDRKLNVGNTQAPVGPGWLSRMGTGIKNTFTGLFNKPDQTQGVQKVDDKWVETNANNKPAVHGPPKPSLTKRYISKFKGWFDWKKKKGDVNNPEAQTPLYFAIQEMMDKMSGWFAPKKKALGDSDGDGVRDGSFEDKLKRKAEELKEKGGIRGLLGKALGTYDTWRAGRAAGKAVKAARTATLAGAATRAVAGTAARSLLTNPYVVGAVGLGVAGIAIFSDVWKWIVDKKRTPARRLRLAQYGFFGSDENRITFNKVLALEKYVFDNTSWNGLEPSISLGKMSNKDFLGFFDIKEDDEQAAKDASEWFNERFIPVYVNWMKALKVRNISVKLIELDDSPPKQLVEIAKELIVEKPEYNVSACPFPLMKRLHVVGYEALKNDLFLFVSELNKKIPIGKTSEIRDENGNLMAGAMPVYASKSQSLINAIKELEASGQMPVNADTQRLLEEAYLTPEQIKEKRAREELERKQAKENETYDTSVSGEDSNEWKKHLASAGAGAATTASTNTSTSTNEDTVSNSSGSNSTSGTTPSNPASSSPVASALGGASRSSSHSSSVLPASAPVMATVNGPDVFHNGPMPTSNIDLSNVPMNTDIEAKTPPPPSPSFFSTKEFTSRGIIDHADPNDPTRPFRRRLSKANAKDAQIVKETLIKEMPAFGITSANEHAFMLGNVEHESKFLPIGEIIKYKPTSLMKNWKHRFPESRPELAEYWSKQNPRDLANYLYGYRMGNIHPNDGWDFRGRGAIQITGRGIYREVGKRIGVDLEKDPDAVLADPVISARVAMGYFKYNQAARNAAKRGDFREARRLINGGDIGMEHALSMIPKYAQKIASGEIRIGQGPDHQVGMYQTGGGVAPPPQPSTTPVSTDAPTPSSDGASSGGSAAGAATTAAAHILPPTPYGGDQIAAATRASSGISTTHAATGDGGSIITTTHANTSPVSSAPVATAPSTSVAATTPAVIDTAYQKQSEVNTGDNISIMSQMLDENREQVRLLHRIASSIEQLPKAIADTNYKFKEPDIPKRKPTPVNINRHTANTFTRNNIVWAY